MHRYSKNRRTIQMESWRRSWGPERQETRQPLFSKCCTTITSPDEIAVRSTDRTPSFPNYRITNFPTSSRCADYSHQLTRFWLANELYHSLLFRQMLHPPAAHARTACGRPSPPASSTTIRVSFFKCSRAMYWMCIAERPSPTFVHERTCATQRTPFQSIFRCPDPRRSTLTPCQSWVPFLNPQFRRADSAPQKLSARSRTLRCAETSYMCMLRKRLQAARAIADFQNFKSITIRKFPIARLESLLILRHRGSTYDVVYSWQNRYPLLFYFMFEV